MTAGAAPSPLTSNRATGRTVVVAAPGLKGGVDEAVGHLFGGPAVARHWSVRVVITRGERPLLAPVVLAAAVLRLAWWRVTGGVDLVHLNVSSKGSAARKMLLGATADLLAVPYVIQLHGGGFAAFYGRLGPRAQGLVRRFFRRADHVFVLGRPFEELATGPLEVDPGRVSVLRNAVAVDEVEIDVDRGSGPDEPLILFTGRLGPGKGTPELIEALGRLADLRWRAVLAGDGQVEATAERVRELGLEGRIEVRGWQSRPVVADLLAAASIFVLPSHTEALSVALLEAMAAGVSSVATPVGAHGEVLVDGENGLMVTPGDVDELTDQLRRLITDPDLRARLGARARVTIGETCSTEVVAAELLATYDLVASAG